MCYRPFDPPVWYHGDRLAPHQAEHRLQVSDSIPPKAAWPTTNGEGVPWESTANIHTRAATDGESDTGSDA